MRRSKVTGFLMLLMMPPVCAASWSCLRTPNFLMYTAGSEKDAREALVILEQVRATFKDILGIKVPENQPATIIAFRDGDDFAPYRPQEDVFAFYAQINHRDLILVQDLLPEHYPSALHEYTHLVIHQTGMKLPLWLNEGFAEFYSTMKPMGKKIVVGRVIQPRLQVAAQGLTNLNDILTADPSSPAYHAKDRVAVFYAESWALVHMLKFSKAYSPRFEQFLDSVGRGEPSAQALVRIYGKPVVMIQADLQAYVRGDHFSEGVIQAKMEKPQSPPEKVACDQVDVEVLLAVIEARGAGRKHAVATLQNLAAANPEKIAPIESLAWVYLNGPDPILAIEPFHAAVKAGSRDAQLCFSYAMKLQRWIPEYDYVAALQRAVEINPQYNEAQEQLAAYEINKHDYAGAVARLHQVKKLERSQAFGYYRALSYALFQMGSTAEAKSSAQRAQQYASTEEERRQAEEVMRMTAGTAPKP